MRLVEITKEIVGRQYDPGNCDCFRIVYDYIGQFISLPTIWRGITLEDYTEIYNEDPFRAGDMIQEFLDEYIQSIPPLKSFSGDILLLQYEDKHPFPAIHAGNQHFIAANPSRGVRVLPLSLYKIKRAWRCQK